MGSGLDTTPQLWDELSCVATAAQSNHGGRQCFWKEGLIQPHVTVGPTAWSWQVVPCYYGLVGFFHITYNSVIDRTGTKPYCINNRVWSLLLIQLDHWNPGRQDCCDH